VLRIFVKHATVGPNLSEIGKQLFDTLLRDQPGTSRSLLELKVANELGVEVASADIHNLLLR